MLENLFHLKAAGTTLKREIVAGCTTFTTLSYIIFVQPAVLSAAGMGHNVFFTYTVCVALQVPWQTALGAVFIAGAFFILFAFVGLREKVMDILPVSFRNAIPAGIG